ASGAATDGAASITSTESGCPPTSPSPVVAVAQAGMTRARMRMRGRSIGGELTKKPTDVDRSWPAANSRISARSRLEAPKDRRRQGGDPGREGPAVGRCESVRVEAGHAGDALFAQGRRRGGAELPHHTGETEGAGELAKVLAAEGRRFRDDPGRTEQSPEGPGQGLGPDRIVVRRPGPLVGDDHVGWSPRAVIEGHMPRDPLDLGQEVAPGRVRVGPDREEEGGAVGDDVVSRAG